MTCIKYLAAGLLLISLAYCKSTKTSSSTPAVAFLPEEKQMTIARQRWAETSEEEVKQGQNIFVTKCTECHKAYEITRFSEKKWLHEIDDMSPKAKLTADEKLKLTKHILSYREAYTVAKAK